MLASVVGMEIVPAMLHTAPSGDTAGLRWDTPMEGMVPQPIPTLADVGDVGIVPAMLLTAQYLDIVRKLPSLGLMVLLVKYNIFSYNMYKA